MTPPSNICSPSAPPIQIDTMAPIQRYGSSPPESPETDKRIDDVKLRFVPNSNSPPPQMSTVMNARSSRTKGVHSRSHRSQVVAPLLVICAAATMFVMIVTIFKVDQSVPSSDSKQLVPVGSLGPKNTNRKHLRYYDSMYYTALQYGADAHTILEVGCASDPFIKYLDWADKRTCVAPYFVDYSSNNAVHKDDKVEKITADFMEYELPLNKKYDLLLCNQVLEHVSNPKSFMLKLIDSAETSIISVPFDWGNCGSKEVKHGCNHVTDNITYERLLMWTHPHKPIHSTIVTEKVDSRFNKRIILVYKSSEFVNGSPYFADYTNNNMNVEKVEKGGISNLIEDEIIAAEKRRKIIASKKNEVKNSARGALP